MNLLTSSLLQEHPEVFPVKKSFLCIHLSCCTEKTKNLPDCAKSGRSLIHDLVNAAWKASQPVRRMAGSNCWDSFSSERAGWLLWRWESSKSEPGQLKLLWRKAAHPYHNSRYRTRTTEYRRLPESCFSFLLQDSTGIPGLWRWAGIRFRYRPANEYRNEQSLTKWSLLSLYC